MMRRSLLIEIRRPGQASCGEFRLDRIQYLKNLNDMPRGEGTSYNATFS